MRRAAPALLLAFVSLSCRRPPAADPAYAAEIGTARALRETRLASDGGWLTLVALHWLTPGENAGRLRPDLLDRARDPRRPAEGLRLRPSARRVCAPARRAGRPHRGERNAAFGRPSRHGPRRQARRRHRRSRETHRHRAGREARREGSRSGEPPTTWDSGASSTFPSTRPSGSTGTFEPYDAPREIETPSAQGPPQKALAPGLVRFTLAGKEYELEPTVESPADETFFFVFSDATAGTETYGAGRFLYAARPKAGETRVVLDFNLAQNPPCAFTPYATCPLPLPKNVLPVRIEAGERVPAGH